MVVCFSECFVRYTLLCCVGKEAPLGLTEAEAYWPGHSTALGEEQISSPYFFSLKGSGLADYKDLHLAR